MSRVGEGGVGSCAVGFGALGRRRELGGEGEGHGGSEDPGPPSSRESLTPALGFCLRSRPLRLVQRGSSD